MHLRLDEILQSLSDQGFIVAPWTVNVLLGNADRKPERVRQHCVVRGADGTAVKLTIAASLLEQRNRSGAFALQHPNLVPKELFFTRIGPLDIWGVEAINGPLFEELDVESTAAARLLSGLLLVESNLARSERGMDEHSLLREWKNLTSSILAIESWKGRDRHFLRDELLPLLLTHLRSNIVKRRWTNGDFTSSNICLGVGDKPFVFDSEFAADSHFFPEDHVRFLRLSPICARHPGLLSGWWKPPPPEWEVFFQLRQLILEHQENTASYFDNSFECRKGSIRFFSEGWFDDFPPEWPTTAVPEPFPSETIQAFWRNADQDWSENRSCRVNIRKGIRQLASFRVKGCFSHWRLDPVASSRTVVVHSILSVSADSPKPTGVMPDSFMGADVVEMDAGIRLIPHGTDPQIHFSLPVDTVGLLVDLQSDL